MDNLRTRRHTNLRCTFIVWAKDREALFHPIETIRNRNTRSNQSFLLRHPKVIKA